MQRCRRAKVVKTMDKELNGCVGDEYDIVCVHAYIALASDLGSLSGGGDSLAPRLSWGRRKESQVTTECTKISIRILSVNYLIILYY